MRTKSYYRTLNLNEMKSFASLLNKMMPKYFPWWIKVRFDSMKILKYRDDSYLILQGSINVDEDWAGKEFYEWNDKQPIFDEGVKLGELMGTEYGNKIREKILHLFKAWYVEPQDLKDVTYDLDVDLNLT